jgi:cyanuric acid amidohydrolase
MKRAQVFRLSMAHPGDLSALEKLISDGKVRAADVVAIIGKTEGNGGVNDFTRGYFTQTLMALLSTHLGKPPSQLIKEIPCVLSSGTEGVMSPHYSVFCVSDEPTATRQYPSALAIGTAFAPVATENVGKRAHVEGVASAAPLRDGGASCRRDCGRKAAAHDRPEPLDGVCPRGRCIRCRARAR